MAEAESLIPRFSITKLLNQDQNDRRIALLGAVDGQQGILLIERAAFDPSLSSIRTLHASLDRIANLGANDIYRWYLANTTANTTPTTNTNDEPKAGENAPDVKLNLIWPCTDLHIRKYSAQNLRMVTESPSVYSTYVRPYMRSKRAHGRLNWVYNILEGRKEQEDVVLRHDPNEEEGEDADEGFLLLPDLNWDRKTLGTLRLITLVQRRDIWSLRDLKKSHVGWLTRMRDRILDAVVKVYPSLDRDQLKLYVHYQPTYYHFHIHVVNVMLEAGATQATGKAFGLENIISQLQTMSGGPDAGMADSDLTYFLGDASELWDGVFGPLKAGKLPQMILDT